MIPKLKGETNSQTDNFVTTSTGYTKKWSLLRNWKMLFYIRIGKPVFWFWFANMRWMWQHEEQLSATKTILGIKYCLWGFSFRDKSFEDVELSADGEMYFSENPGAHLSTQHCSIRPTCLHTYTVPLGPRFYTNTLFHCAHLSTQIHCSIGPTCLHKCAVPFSIWQHSSRLFLITETWECCSIFKFGRTTNFDWSFNTWSILRMTGLLRLMEIVIIIIIILPSEQSFSKIYLAQFTLSTATHEVRPRGSTWHLAAKWHGEHGIDCNIFSASQICCRQTSTFCA